MRQFLEQLLNKQRLAPFGAPYSNSFIKLQLFAEDDGTGGGGGSGSSEKKDPTPDYKALYEQEHAENERLTKDNKAYADRERDRMTDEEKRKADEQAQQEELNKLRAQVARGKAESIFSGKGVSDKIYKGILDEIVPIVPADKLESVSSKLADAISKSCADAVEKYKTSTIANGTVYPTGKETDSGDSVKKFVQDLQGTVDTKKSDDIKNHYK